MVAVAGSEPLAPEPKLTANDSGSYAFGWLGVVPNSGHGGPEDSGHEYRQQAVNKLGGDVHEQRDKTQRPDARRQSSECTRHGRRRSVAIGMQSLHVRGNCRLTKQRLQCNAVMLALLFWVSAQRCQTATP